MGKSLKEIGFNELALLASALENIRDRLIVKIFLETGCKVGELSDLKVKDFEDGKVFFSERFVLISKELFGEVGDYVLKNRLKNGDYLFFGRQSCQLTPKRVQQIVGKISSEVFDERLNCEDIRKISINEKLGRKSFREVKFEVGLKRIDSRKYLNSDEIKIIRKNILDERDLLIIDLLLSGLGPKKICDLRVSQILKLELENKLKRRLERFAVDKNFSPKSYLFLTRQRSNLTRVRIFQIVKTAGEKVGMKISPQIIINSARVLDEKNKSNIFYLNLGGKNG